MAVIPCRIPPMALMVVEKVMECANAIRSCCQSHFEQSNYMATAQVRLVANVTVLWNKPSTSVVN